MPVSDITQPAGRRLVMLILLGAAVVRLVFALITPAWESPDEYPHYWYAEQIAATGELPVSRHEFPAYQAYQPPLYYLMLSSLIGEPGEAPEFKFLRLPDSGLIILRLFSVVCGTLTVWFTLLLVQRIESLNDLQRLTATALVAFLPTFVGVSSTINNDVLVTMISAACLVMCFRSKWTLPGALVIGLLFGAAVLTKLTALALAPVIIYQWWKQKNGTSRQYSALVMGGVGAALGVGLLLARNVWMYDSLLVINPGVQAGWSFSTAHLTWALRNLIWSFWLAFGRTYTLTPPPAVYIITVGPMMLGALVGLWKSRSQYRAIVTACGIGLGTTVAGSLLYTLSYPIGEMTSWGKNLFPVLPLVSMLLAIGLSELHRAYATVVTTAGVSMMILGCVWAAIALWFL